MKKEKQLYKAVIIKGKYAGETGMATKVNDLGNVIFYPDSEICYRICKPFTEIEYKE